MQEALRIETTILPGKRIEITAPELPEGETVELIVLLPKKPSSGRGSILELVRSLPARPSPRAVKTWEEYERQLAAERDAWDR